MVTAIIILVVSIDLVANIVFLRWWIKRLRAQAIEALRQAAGGERVYHAEDCNFFGRLSSGYKQWRGNGVLALTEKGIRFRMLLPRKEMFIPIGAVKEISQPRSFLGKRRAGELLRVDFAAETGEDDACAWLVPSLQWWSEALEALRAGSQPPPAPWEGRA